jgi:hypothetical protein
MSGGFGKVFSGVSGSYNCREEENTITVDKTYKFVQDISITMEENVFQCQLPFWQYQKC